MFEPYFLTVDQVIRQHDLAIDLLGGSPGVLSSKLVESAVHAPKNKNFYEPESDCYELAACYLFHLTLNHGFNDGNKRTGAFSALWFLRLNGIEAAIPPTALYNFIKAVADGRIEEESKIAPFFRHWCHPKMDYEAFRKIIDPSFADRMALADGYAHHACMMIRNKIQDKTLRDGVKLESVSDGMVRVKYPDGTSSDIHSDSEVTILTVTI